MQIRAMDFDVTLPVRTFPMTRRSWRHGRLGAGLGLGDGAGLGVASGVGLVVGDAVGVGLGAGVGIGL
jgi:hypothetical protein